MTSFSLAALTVVALGISISSLSQAQDAGEQTADKLQVLKSQFEELKADAYSAQEKFDERYLGELKKLEEKAQGEADLDLVLAVREEAKSFRARETTASKPSPHTELARLQKIYDDQKVRFEVERADKLAALIGGYRKQLTDLQAELTKSGDIDGAVAVQAEIRRADADAPPVPEATSLEDILTTGKWLRYTKINKGIFVFEEGGGLRSENFKSKWVSWEIKDDRVYISETGGKRHEFRLTQRRPLLLNCVTPGAAHMRFEKVE